MGYFSSSQTTKSKTTTETAPLSAEGREWDSLFTGLFMQTLDQGGYDVAPTEKTEYKDQARGVTLEGQLKDYRQRLDDLYKQYPSKGTAGAGGPARTRFDAERMAAGGGDPVEAEKRDLLKKIEKSQKELDTLGKVTYTDYTLTKREDPRVLNAIEKYGENSPQVAEMRGTIKQEGVYQAETMAAVNTEYLKNLKKFVSGDMSYTDEQRKQIDSFIGPMKKVIMKTTDDLFAEADRTNTNVGAAIDKLSKQIEMSGYEINDALSAAQIQVEQSGKTLLGVLEEVNTNANAKAQFEFGLMSQQIDQQTARQAALLGLPPGSMAEKNQALAMKANALKSIELTLAEDASNKRLGIAADVEAGKKSISLARVQLAENQAGKKEGVAQMGIGLAESLGAKRESITGARGNALLSLEQQRQAQLQAAAVGQLPAMLSAGQSGLGFNQAQLASQIGLTQGIMTPAQQQLAIEQQRTFQEATQRSKSTTTSSPSIASSIMGIAGGLAGAAGGIMGGVAGMGMANAAQAGKLGVSSGGGWSMPTPSSMNLVSPLPGIIGPAYG